MTQVRVTVTTDH